MIQNTKLTCGNCQLICWGDQKETKENYKILTNSGCVIQKEDGSLEIHNPEEAAKVFNSLNKRHRRLYYKKFK